MHCTAIVMLCLFSEYSIFVKAGYSSFANEWRDDGINLFFISTKTKQFHIPVKEPSSGGWPHSANDSGATKDINTNTRASNYSPSTLNRPQKSLHTGDKRRISEIKCEEYSESVTETLSAIPLVINPEPVKIKIQKCNSVNKLIVGGENTSIAEFPHMAVIGFLNKKVQRIVWACGGSLISQQFVLTAAHCTTSKLGIPVRVRLGEYNLNRNDDGAHPEDFTIAEIIIHPEFRPPLKYNDIALLKLGKMVGIKSHIRPACLYAKDELPEQKVVAVGWGRTDRDGKQSDILQKVSLNVIQHDTCDRIYRSTVRKEILPRGITHSQICAGVLSGGRDTCQGDSGGPIEYLSPINRCVHFIVGITSFGKNCAQPNFPGVYTRISSYISWIENIVWGN